MNDKESPSGWPLSEWSVAQGLYVCSGGYLRCRDPGPLYCAQFLLASSTVSWFVYGVDIEIEDDRASPAFVTSVGFAPREYQEREIGMGESFGWSLQMSSSYFSSSNYKGGDLYRYSPSRFPYRATFNSRTSIPPKRHTVHIGWESLTKEVFIEELDLKAHFSVDLERREKRLFLTIVFTPSPFLKIRISKPSSPESLLKFVRRGPKLEWLIRIEQLPAPHFDITMLPDDCWYLIFSQLNILGPLVETCKSFIGTVISYAKKFLGSDFVQEKVVINWHKFFSLSTHSSMIRCGFDKLAFQSRNALSFMGLDTAIERKFRRTIDLCLKSSRYNYYTWYLAAAVRSRDKELFDIFHKEHLKRGYSHLLQEAINTAITCKNKYAMDLLLHEKIKFDEAHTYKLLSYGSPWKDYLSVTGTQVDYNKVVYTAFREKDIEVFTSYYKNVNSFDTFYKIRYQFSDLTVQKMCVFMEQNQFDFSQVNNFSYDLESLEFYVRLEKTNLTNFLQNLFRNYSPVIEEEKKKYELMKHKWTAEEIYSLTPSPIFALFIRPHLLDVFLDVFPIVTPLPPSILDRLVECWGAFEVFAKHGLELEINNEFLQKCFRSKRPKHVNLIMSNKMVKDITLDNETLRFVYLDYISFPNFTFLWPLLNIEEKALITHNLLWKINQDVFLLPLPDLSPILQEIPRLPRYEERVSYLSSTPIQTLRNMALVLTHPYKYRKMGCTPFLRACKVPDGLQMIQLMYCFYPEGPFELETRYRNSPLHIIARRGTPEMAAFVLSFNPTLLNQENFWNETPLHVAAKTGNSKVTKFLLQQAGIMVNTRDETRSTPFLRACKSGSLETVAEYLNDKVEVDCEAVTVRGESALQILISRKCLGPLKLFVPYIFKKYSPSTQNFINSTCGLPKLPTIFQISTNGETPLEMAFRLRYLAIADYLLSMGVVPKKILTIPRITKHTKACRWQLLEKRFLLLLAFLTKEPT